MRKIAIAILLLTCFAACKPVKKKIPQISEKKKAVIKTVNGKQVTDTVYQTIPDFTFVNQYGDSTGGKQLKNKIYVADFFFTSCPSICPIMERNMLNVYNAYKDSVDIKIVSFTIDPRHDTVPVL